MDKYLKRPERSNDALTLAEWANVSAADRAKQYKKSKVFEGAHNWQKVHA